NLRADRVTGSEDNNAFGVGHVNRATKIDIFARIFETDLDLRTRVNSDHWFARRRNYSYVRETNVFIAWSSSWIAPFFSTCIRYSAQQVIVNHLSDRARSGHSAIPHQNRSAAQGLDGRHIVTHKQDRPARARDLSHLAETLFLK